jgi:hypothetical protein
LTGEVGRTRRGEEARVTSGEGGRLLKIHEMNRDGGSNMGVQTSGLGGFDACWEAGRDAAGDEYNEGLDQNISESDVGFANGNQEVEFADEGDDLQLDSLDRCARNVRSVGIPEWQEKLYPGLNSGKVFSLSSWNCSLNSESLRGPGIQACRGEEILKDKCNQWRDYVSPKRERACKKRLNLCITTQRKAKTICPNTMLLND